MTFVPPFPWPDPHTTSSARSSERDPKNASQAGRGSHRAGSFLPCPMIPDPQVQIDLRDPPERMSDRIPPPRPPVRPRPAPLVREKAYDWRNDPAYDPTAHVDDDPDWEAIFDEQQKVDASGEQYLAEEVAHRVAEGDSVDEEEDDPELLAELAYAEMIANEEVEDA